LVIAEVVYFIAKWLGPDRELRFLTDLSRGVFTSEPVQPEDWLRIGQLVWRYREMRLGTVDASVIAAAERLGVTEVATIDRRHFSVVRPRHAVAFTLLP
jgi:predicted nucleic acid-binding protein